LGIKHPIDKKSNTPIVLTTDFMITVSHSGKQYNVARTIKPSSQIESNRVIEKFEIERRYWEARGINWAVVTEKDISNTFAKNIEWIHASYNLEPTPELSVNEMLCIGESLKKHLKKPGVSVRRVTNSLDRELNIESGTSLTIFKYFIARKEIIVDMEKKIDIRMLTDNIKQIVQYDGRVMTV